MRVVLGVLYDWHVRGHLFLKSPEFANVLCASLPCEYESLGGKNYDLNPLKNNAADYTVTSTYNFKINLCRATVGTYSGAGSTCGVAVQTGGTYACVGQYQTLGIYDNAPGQLVLTLNAVADNSLFFLFCNSTVGVGTPVFNRKDSDGYLFTWRTAYAC